MKKTGEFVHGPCRKKGCTAKCTMFKEDPYKEIPNCLTCEHPENYHIQLRIVENYVRQKRPRDVDNREYPECKEIARESLLPEESPKPMERPILESEQIGFDFGETYKPQTFPNLSQSTATNNAQISHPDYEIIFDELIATSRIGTAEDVKVLLDKYAVTYRPPIPDLNSTFPWTNEIRKCLYHVFKYRTFRPKQEEIINSIMLNHDCIAILSTGSGKSLLYQLPGFLTNGITIVISPLVALIEDQVSQLKQLNIPAISATAGSNPDMTSYKFIYITPEKLCRSLVFLQKLIHLYNLNQISRFVVDEAHCISKWGNDFRQDYKVYSDEISLKFPKELGILRKTFPNVPIFACTATADKKIMGMIKSTLQLNFNCNVFTSNPNRENLKYYVYKKTSRYECEEIITYIKKFPNKESGIIFCHSVNDTERIANALRDKGGISAEHYNGQMTPEIRAQVQSRWTCGQTQVIVATSSFGMGVNKKDVRFVIHHTMPHSIDSYIQESGRCGRYCFSGVFLRCFRDGEYAECVLFYSFKDRRRVQSLVKGCEEQINAMVDYCETFECRRKVLFNSMGMEFWRESCNKMCDNCNVQNIYKYDVTMWAESMLKIVKKSPGDFTLNRMISVFRGLGKKEECVEFGVGKIFSLTEAQTLAYKLVKMGVLVETLIAINPTFPKHYVSVINSVEISVKFLKVNKKNETYSRIKNGQEKVFIELKKYEKSDLNEVLSKEAQTITLKQKKYKL